MINETEIIYNQIENKIINHEIYQNVKDYSKAKQSDNIYQIPRYVIYDGMSLDSFIKMVS